MREVFLSISFGFGLVGIGLVACAAGNAGNARLDCACCAVHVGLECGGVVVGRHCERGVNCVVRLGDVGMLVVDVNPDLIFARVSNASQWWKAENSTYLILARKQRTSTRKH